jgi:hypothetical protein
MTCAQDITPLRLLLWSFPTPRPTRNWPSRAAWRKPPAAAASAQFNVKTGQARQQQRRSRSVANAHFTEQQGIARQGSDQRNTVLQGLLALQQAHRRLLAGVSRTLLTTGHLAHAQTRSLRAGGQTRQKVVRHAAIHHAQCNLVQA